MGSRDVLGWWIVPIGLVVGSGLPDVDHQICALGARVHTADHMCYIESESTAERTTGFRGNLMNIFANTKGKGDSTGANLFPANPGAGLLIRDRANG